MYSYFIANADISYKKTGLTNKISNGTKIRKTIVTVSALALLVRSISGYLNNGYLIN